MKKSCFIFFMLCNLLFSQDKDSLDFSQYTLFENDSLITNLDEIQLLPKLTFKSYNDKRYYYWFRKKVLRAYPLCKNSSQGTCHSLDEQLDSISSRRKRKRTHEESAEVFGRGVYSAA